VFDTVHHRASFPRSHRPTAVIFKMAATTAAAPLIGKFIKKRTNRPA
jgi:hypothetical protein